MKMIKSPLHYLLLLASFCLINTSQAGEYPDQPHIIVSGSHTLRVEPDQLQLSLNISDTQLELARASQSVETRSIKLITRVKGIGIKPEDIQATELRITPRYKWQNQEQILTGTEVTRIIKLTLRNLDNYNQLIQLILDARVGRINNTQLFNSKQEELRKQALKGAIQDAKDKAELIAASISQALDGVYSINALSSQAIRPVARISVQEIANNTAFEPGLIEITERIDAIFLLKKSAPY
ncbi:MAG: SIMPL domain-containing protein [Gammaproteobacteria bacterium]|nr:SIMPL domain-containing protein [Gammaproteobacteria bacterium]